MSMIRFNIAHVLPYPTVGGLEIATLRIAEAIEGDQFSSTAFHLNGATPVREMFLGAGFEVACYDGVEPSYRHPQEFLRATWRLANEFKRRKINLVHCSDQLAGHYTALAGRLAGLPVLCHIRNRSGQISRRDQSFLWPVNKFAFVSRDTWRTFGMRVPPSRGVVIYDGLDVVPASVDLETSSRLRHDAGREFGIPESAKIVGMVARIAPQKDYRTLVKAAARVVAARPDVRFLLVGEYSGAAPYRTHYEKVRGWMADYGVTPYFVFTDFRNDAVRLMGAMDVFVLSTHCEGLPLVILEAMAQAKPVVATAVDGIPEIVLNGQTGLLHQHEDDAGLATHILSLLNDEGRAAQLGEAGRRFVSANFTKEQFATSMANLYREMLGDHAARRHRRGEMVGTGREKYG